MDVLRLLSMEVLIYSVEHIKDGLSWLHLLTVKFCNRVKTLSDVFLGF